ncbi:MAG: dihydroorotate dehydrogenase electron transfer subunit [Pirellulales bacterium]|nr:dihydroorotate dehydrogenase electron transfer subunit [Pirellulales bacterium]
MTLAHEAAHFADRAWHGTVAVIENVPLARDTYRVRFDCPELAARITPGQFVMLRIAGGDDPLLGRPLALYDTVLDAEGNPRGIDVVYLVVGKLTRRLAELRPGARLEVWGPLGNGFPVYEAEHLILVAGGIGQTPFLALAREQRGLRVYGQAPRAVSSSPRRITFCYGARSQEYLAGLDDFASLGIEVCTSTDDGSAGHHGFVTDLVAAALEERSTVDRTAADARRVVCCGPEPMMAAVARIAAQAGVPCDASLETPMACGLGICFSCVVRVRTGEPVESSPWDYRRSCVEGPVFDAARIVF